MLPDRVSNPGPLTYESGALPIALRGPADIMFVHILKPHGQLLQNFIGLLGLGEQRVVQMVMVR